MRNPIIACRQTINDLSQEVTNKKELINYELEDLENMLEYLKIDYQAKNKMSIMEEKPRLINSEDFIKSLYITHSRLANNGNNSLMIESVEKFPIRLKIPNINSKRIISIIITNSLKNTNNGEVYVKFDSLNKKTLQESFSNFDFQFIGYKINFLNQSDYEYQQRYIQIKVIDNRHYSSNISQNFFGTELELNVFL